MTSLHLRPEIRVSNCAMMLLIGGYFEHNGAMAARP